MQHTKIYVLSPNRTFQRYQQKKHREWDKNFNGFQDMAYIKAYHSPKTLLTSVTIKESLSIHFENIKKPLVSKFLGGV